MTRFDPTLTSAFRMDWLVPLDETTADDYTRAVAEQSEAILRAARFLRTQGETGARDMEIRLWVEAACGNGCVSITWEPGLARFGFHLLDESLHERLGCVVFDALPCVDAEDSLHQADLVLDAALSALADALPGETLEERAARVRHAREAVRIPVVDMATFDPGVEP